MREIKWRERCPRCGKKMTPEGWIRREGYVCTRCKEIEE
jgi:tRNA(Ile2) C34 agmatinyltransferase TiaS